MRCLAKGQYIDEKAKDKFKMLCHLEDFEIQYWELQQENKKLNGAIQTYDILSKANVEENKRLQQENKILRENAEHNDKVVDKVNWENMLLKKENKQLKERIEYLERSNNRREDTILEQRQEISDLEDNWNKLKEKVNEGMRVYRNRGYDLVFDIEEISKEDLNEFISYLAFQVMEQLMIDIEQGSDSNVKD